MKKFIKTKTTPTILITSGCSFTYVNDACSSWPLHLSQSLDIPLLNTAMGSQGNGMIARKAIWAIHEQLKTTPADQLLVGVMWSGPSRSEQYINRKIKLKQNIDNWLQNPSNFVENDPGSWVIYNSYWKMPFAQIYYRYLYDEMYAQIQTLENIIRVQNYLKLHNIKYFMSTYTSEVFAVKDNPNLDHLYEQIDYDKFLPVDGCYEWCKEKSGLPIPDPNDNHPSTEQHKLFSQQVIVPFLTNTYNIDNA